MPLFEQVVVKKELLNNTMNIKTGDKLSVDFLYDLLFEYKFDQVDFVTRPGEFAVRGGIIDVYSFGDNDAYRIEFFGEAVDSIRSLI